jgi:hypothetical protein
LPPINQPKVQITSIQTKKTATVAPLPGRPTGRAHPCQAVAHSPLDFVAASVPLFASEAKALQGMVYFICDISFYIADVLLLQKK